MRTGVTVVVPARRQRVGRPGLRGVPPPQRQRRDDRPALDRGGRLLHSPIGITNTHSVGVVRDALVEIEVAESGCRGVGAAGRGRDLGRHAQRRRRLPRDRRAREGGVRRGVRRSRRRGLGRRRHGDGVPRLQGRHRYGVAQGAARTRSACSCRPTTAAASGSWSTACRSGCEVGEDVVPGTDSPVPPGSGSIIGIVATDAPLLPLQCRRLAQRASFGVARTGGVGENNSGDLFLAFATGNRGMHRIGDDAPAVAEVRTMAQQRHEPALRRRHRGDRGGDPQRDPGLADDDRPRSHRPHAAARPAAGGAGEVRAGRLLAR